MKNLLLLTCISLLAGFDLAAQRGDYDKVVEGRLKQIRSGLDSMIFVRRFEAIETPCVCLDASNDMLASHYPNSNYKARSIGGKTDPGYSCLSKLNAQYLRLSVDTVTINPVQIRGTVNLTYGYPAGNIMQYLGMTQPDSDKSHSFFNKLLSSVGMFIMFPEEDKFRIEFRMTQKPFDSLDKYYGFLEVIKDGFGSSKTGYFIYFDKMELRKGNNNNEISLRFGSTSHNDESNYYARKVYEVLKNADSSDPTLKAESAWLSHYLQDPGCPQTKYIYGLAVQLLKNAFMLPNTQPFPPH